MINSKQQILIDKIKYYPNTNWSHYDFLINKYFWIKYGLENALEIRKTNLIDIKEILEENNILYWVQGKTLLGLYKHRKLLDDHDDDLAIWIGQKEPLLHVFKSSIEKRGFRKIRDTQDIISFERNYRYIDICLFKSINNTRVGYGKKQFSKIYFDKLDKLRYEGVDFFVPSQTDDLLQKMYPLEFGLKKEIFSGLFFKIQKIITSPKKVLQYAKQKIPGFMRRAPFFLSTMLSFITAKIGVKVCQLSEKEFLDLQIEPAASFNWKWRARHLNLVTNNGKAIKVREIINYLSSEHIIKSIEANIVETNLTKSFDIPSNLDMDFWWNGNNYFWYCIKYQFRKDVVPYNDVNKYIIEKNSPPLYTSEYYEALIEMKDYEIRKFLSHSLIEIEDNAVTSGKHRVFAMIGRMLSGKSYIPFWTLVLSNKTRSL